MKLLLNDSKKKTDKYQQGMLQPIAHGEEECEVLRRK
jgi:hypothetical protein